MGKISDIWVRLGLKKTEFDKGMDDAVKKTEKAGGKMSSVLSAAKAGWAAIGAAVIAFGHEMINATNKVGDAWANTMAGVKGAWQSVLADISNYKPDFSSFKNFFKNEWKWIKNTAANAQEAGELAKEMSRAFDAEFELTNSIKIQRAKISGELADLQVEMRNTSLSPEARMAAAKRYRELLEPIYEAEIAIRTDMLDAAVKAWMGGTGATATTQEVVDFFTRIGTDAAGAIADHPELARIYDDRKGDKANQPIFDAITALAQAENGLAVELKLVNRTANSVMALMNGMERLDLSLPSVDALTAQAKIDMPDMFTREWLDRQKELGLEAVEMQAEWIDIMAQGAQMLEGTIVTAMGNGLQAITDLMFGLEGADAKSVMAAFIAPFGDFAKTMGAMIMSYGISMEAFRDAFTKPWQAIAAGAGLMAIGAAISSGAKSLSSGNLGGGSSPSYGGGSSYGNTALNYGSTLTVYVEGKISGSDIIIAGTNQQNKWNR